MSAKRKYESIDRSKLNKDVLRLLDLMKKKTDNFENEDVVKASKVEGALDRLIAKYPDAVKKSSSKSKPKAKAKAKKPAKSKQPSKSKPKRETVMTVAKRIRKDGEKWQDALKRAKSQMGKETKKSKTAVESEMSKLKKLISEDAVLKGFNKSDLQRDAVRKAKPRGKRKTSTKGETTNQYGTFKNKVGRPYWESRENRSDRYSPSYPKNKPFLEDGGLILGGSTTLRDNGDIMPLGTANADAVFEAGGVTGQTVVNPNEAMADLTSTYGFDDVYAKGGTLESKFEGYDSMYNYALAKNFTPRQLAEELRFMTNLQNKGDKELYDFLNNLSNMFPDTPVSEFKKGGMMQGYNDRLNESLGNRDGAEDMMMQSYKDRRDESKGMEKAMGRRAYQSVGTMDRNNDPDDLYGAFEKGGEMKQGYNDRLNESLGNRDGAEDMMMQSYKDRRDESKGMEKSMGRRAYQSVGTMDDVGNPTDPNVIEEMEIYIKKEIPKLDKERFFTEGMKRKEAKRRFYKKFGYGAYNPRFSLFEKGGKTQGKTLAENFNLKDEVKNVEFWKNDVIVQGKNGKVARIDLDKGERIELNAKGGKIGYRE